MLRCPFPPRSRLAGGRPLCRRPPPINEPSPTSAENSFSASSPRRRRSRRCAIRRCLAASRGPRNGRDGGVRGAREGPRHRPRQVRPPRGPGQLRRGQLTLPPYCTVAFIIGICIARFVHQKSYLRFVLVSFAAPTKLIPLRLSENCARLDCGRVNWAIRISEGL